MPGLRKDVYAILSLFLRGFHGFSALSSATALGLTIKLVEI